MSLASTVVSLFPQHLAQMTCVEELLFWWICCRDDRQMECSGQGWREFQLWSTGEENTCGWVDEFPGKLTLRWRFMGRAFIWEYSWDQHVGSGSVSKGSKAVCRGRSRLWCSYCRVSADPSGSSEAGMALLNCPELTSHYLRPDLQRGRDLGQSSRAIPAEGVWSADNLPSNWGNYVFSPDLGFWELSTALCFRE